MVNPVATLAMCFGPSPVAMCFGPKLSSHWHCRRCRRCCCHCCCRCRRRRRVRHRCAMRTPAPYTGSKAIASNFGGRGAAIKHPLLTVIQASELANPAGQPLEVLEAYGSAFKTVTGSKLTIGELDAVNKVCYYFYYLQRTSTALLSFVVCVRMSPNRRRLSMRDTTLCQAPDCFWLCAFLSRE